MTNEETTETLLQQRREPINLMQVAGRYSDVQGLVGLGVTVVRRCIKNRGIETSEFVIFTAFFGSYLAVLIFPPDFMYSYDSTYSYTTSVSTNTTVENVTLLLPFPQGEDVGEDPTSNLWIYDNKGKQVTDWQTEAVETERGPMLRLHADRLEEEGLCGRRPWQRPVGCCGRGGVGRKDGVFPV